MWTTASASSRRAARATPTHARTCTIQWGLNFFMLDAKRFWVGAAST